jgi:hypothetical protein
MTMCFAIGAAVMGAVIGSACAGLAVMLQRRLEALEAKDRANLSSSGVPGDGVE